MRFTSKTSNADASSLFILGLMVYVPALAFASTVTTPSAPTVTCLASPPFVATISHPRFSAISTFPSSSVNTSTVIPCGEVFPSTVTSDGVMVTFFMSAALNEVIPPPSPPSPGVPAQTTGCVVFGSLANAIGALVATIATASQKASARFVYELFINHSSFAKSRGTAQVPPARALSRNVCLAVTLIIGVLLLAVQ